MHAAAQRAFPVALAAAVAALGACGGRTQPARSAQSGEPPAVTGRAQPASPDRPVAVRSEPWTFEGAPGTVLRTRHFSIYTTERDPVITDRLPRFLEAALTHHTTAIVPLERPAAPMDAFIMANRTQWQNLTMRMLGSRGRVLTFIERGGFTTGGRSFLFDIGTSDTFVIAAHEGWHQFTQSTFVEQLPISIEEGLAAYMEGHRFTGQTVLFLPWANAERYEQLSASARRGQLLPLEDLLSSTPESILQRPGNSNESAVAYYAQAWALIHFLREGEGGRYRPALEAMVRDAAGGRLTANVRLARGERSGMIAQRAGPAVLLAYCNTDLDRLGREYRAFIQTIVAPMSRGAVLSGNSPIPAAP
ncbi:MAG: DUF1570 domain-containing protein [Phycisphaerales bacterium]